MRYRLTSILITGVYFLTTTITGCYSYHNVPKYDRKEVPVEYIETEYQDVPIEYTEIEYKEKPVEYEIPIYELRSPYFQVGTNRMLNIAVLEFTESRDAALDKGYGIEASNEIEYRLMKHTEKFQQMNLDEIRKEFEEATKKYHVEKGLFEEWYYKNKISKYQILSRDRLYAIFREHEIKDATPNIDTIIQKAQLIGVDCLITGHVKALTDNNTSFIMKAIIPETGKVVFYERYEGKYDYAFQNAIQSFFFNIKVSHRKHTKIRYEKKPVEVTKIRYEKRPVEVVKTKYEYETYQSGTKREKYYDPEKESVVIVAILIALGFFLLKAFAQAESE